MRAIENLAKFDWLKMRNVEILGTDVSNKAIATARSGQYTQFEIQRGISVAQMLNFFTDCDYNHSI